MYLQILSYIENKERRIADLRDIFFESALVTPASISAREDFYYKYAGVYIEHWPDDVFLACDLETQKTLGYLIGCRNSSQAEPILGPLLRSYTLFSDLFKKYPAHLHMNTSPVARGKGVGAFLLQEYFIELRKFRVRGLHLVTSPEQRNVKFYTRYKFLHQEIRTFDSKNLLFMGRKL